MTPKGSHFAISVHFPNRGSEVRRPSETVTMAARQR